jgi:hypothetical protein
MHHPAPILVNRMGGLGNQLFQYAAARAVAFHHPHTQIYVETETENSHNHKKYEYASLFMKQAILLPSPSLLPPTLNEFHQKSSFFPWSPETISPPVRLYGYFQYYPAIQPIIPNLVKEWKQALQPFLDTTLSEEKTVFLHVRRGDYLCLPHYHYVQTKTYYENAFQQWKTTYPSDDYQLFLVSEDWEWCRQQDWSFPYQLYEDADEIKTLAFMSQCKAGAIIGNSSFSYWGALLSESPHVFYPEKWIAETVHDLFPSNWCCVTG